MFGYLNLKDPTKIGNNEAQEANNVRMDDGFLEFAEFPIDLTINASGQDINNIELFLGTSQDSTVMTVSTNPQGFIKRKNSSVKSTCVGVARPAGMGGIVLVAVAHGSQPYPPGVYDYYISAYDPDTGEESAPHLKQLTIGVNQVSRFTLFPAGGAEPDNDGKTNLEWRIYRRPLGGSEWLRVLPTTTIPAYTANPGPYDDVTADNDLGVPCNTIGNLSPPGSASTMCFHVHGERLWFQVGGFNELRYSDPYLLGQVPSDNYFKLNSAIIGLHTVDEALVVLCEKDVFIIYGDDATTFVVKQATSSNIGAVRSTRKSSARIGNALFWLGSLPANRNQSEGVFAMLGGQVSKVSFPVDSLFPSPDGISAYGAGNHENRFFVVKTINTTGTAFLYVIYDTIAQGFLTASQDATTFTYRSKEFGRPGAWDNMRRAFVRGQGDFTIELYYDGILEDPIDFSLGDSPQTKDFTVPGLRSNYFSFRFIGQSNAKIYEFGRLE